MTAGGRWLASSSRTTGSTTIAITGSASPTVSTSRSRSTSLKDNGHNGISYSGNSSLIHDNIVHHNTQFGIYVKDGVDHQVYDNTAYLNGTGDDDNIKILGSTIPPPAQTYYVDCGVNGDDTRTPIQAKDPASPWKTITKGVFHAQAGSTILVSPGTCAESVESKRDGTKAARIVLRSMVPGGAIIQPPAGTNGFSSVTTTTRSMASWSRSLSGRQARPP